MVPVSKIVGGASISSGATSLMLGTIFSQLLILACAPILTRLYSPEQFGIFGVYVSIFALFNIMTSLRYELAIPLPRTKAFALNVMVLCLLLTVLTGFLSFLIAYTWGAQAFELLGLPFYNPVVWILPFGLLCGGAYKSFTFWAFRNSAFKAVAGARLFQSSGLSVSQIFLGFMGIGSIGLMMGHAIGFACAAVGLCVLVSNITVVQWQAVSISRMRSAVYRYKKFPIFSSWSDLVNVIGSQFPVIFVAAIFSSFEAGFYLLANRIANAPVAVIAEATSKSLMAAAAKSRGTPELVDMTRSVFKSLLRTGLGPMAMIALIAPQLTDFVFGDDWRKAGYYLQLLILWTLSVYIFVPLMSLYAVLELQKQELYFQVLIFSSRIGGLIFGALTGTIEDALIYFSIAAAFSYSACGLWILTKVGIRIGTLLSDILPEIGIAILQVGCVVLSGYIVSLLEFRPLALISITEMMVAMVTALFVIAIEYKRFRQ